MTCVTEVVEILERAFAPSGYLDPSNVPFEFLTTRERLEQSSLSTDARLRDDKSHELLTTAYCFLKEKGSSSSEEPLRHFFLAILSKYLSKGKEEYISHLESALRCDPTFPEAAIALREGEQYLDPFCYPGWEALRDGTIKAPALVLQTAGSNICRFDVVRNNGLLIPAIFVKHPRNLFRGPLTSSTPVKILVNAEAVIPSMPLIVQVVPVIFDDPGDPFWCVNYLNPFPIGDTELEGIPVLLPTDYQPLLGHHIAMRFCWGTPRCALFVLDENNRLLMSRLIVFDDREAEQLREMDQVLRALGDGTISAFVWKSTGKLHLEAFYREVENPVGMKIGIPKGRGPGMARKLIHAVTVKDGKLALKTESDVTSIEQEKRNDVFFSHAHEDNEWVLEIAQWLRSIWPSLRIFHTNPKDLERFNEDPLYFYKEMRLSRCTVFLSTPRSLKKPWVGAEQGAASVCTSIVYLLADGASLNDLKRTDKEDLFTKIDYGKVILLENGDSWTRFVRLLVKELNRSVPEQLPNPPKLKPNMVAASKHEDLHTKFIDEFLWKIVLPERQTENQAAALLEQVEAHLARQGGEFSAAVRLTSRWPLRRRLTCVLMSFDDEPTIMKILDHFPALIDVELLEEIQRIAYGTSDRQMLSRQARLERLVGGILLQMEISRSPPNPQRRSLRERLKSAVARYTNRFRE